MYPEIRSQRPAVSFRRWLLTVAVLCLPILAAVVFSGALAGGGTAYAAVAAGPARRETETGTPGGTGTAQATGTFRPNTTAPRGQASKIIYNAITGAR